MAFAMVGAFAGGFADGFLAAYQARTQRRYYEQMSQYYRYIMLRQGYNPDVGKFYDFDKHSWSSDTWQPNPYDSPTGAIKQIIDNYMHGHPNTGSMSLPGGGKIGNVNYGGNDETKAYIVQGAIKRGMDPNAALAMVQGESSGDIGAKGDHQSSFGLFQLHYGGISPSEPKPGMGDAFTAATGLDARDPSTWKQQVDFALDGAASRGWGDWATTRDKLGFDNFTGIGRGTTSPTTAAATTTTPKVGAMSPQGGPYVSQDGKTYATDADGKIIPTPVSDVPSAAATPQSAETAAPGGGFRLPGLGGGPTMGSSPVPSPGGVPQVSQQPGLQAGNARSPLSRDPYWRPNPPLPAAPQQAQPAVGSPAPAVPPPRPVAGAPAQPMMPPRTPTPDSAGPPYVPGTPPRPPHTPTPPTAGPEYRPQVAASPVPAPTTVAGGLPPPPEPPKLTPPDVAPPSGGGGGGMQWSPEPDVQVASSPYVDPWVDFQQQNPYAAPISFAPPMESRKGGPIGYDDGGDVGDTKSQSPIGKLSKALSGNTIGGDGSWSPSPDASPASPSFVDAWAGYKPQTGYDDGGDVEPPSGGGYSINPGYPMAMAGAANSAIRNAPAAYQAFTDPNNPTGPTAANMGTQLRNAGTALALPVITRDLLRGLYSNPQQMQPRQGVPSPASPPPSQPMNTAKQFPSPDEYNGAPTPVWSGSPMGAVGTAIQPYSPTIGNAIVNVGNTVDNWVDAHMPANDRLKAQQDEANNFNDEVRENRTQLERVYHPRQEEWNKEEEQRQLETPEREVQWQRTYMLPLKRTQEKHARGGPVMGYAKGGTIVKLQGGGNPATWGSYGSSARNPSYTSDYTPVPYASYQDPATATPSMGKFNAGTYADPGYQLWRGGEQWLGSQPTSPYNAQAAEMTPGGVEANYNALPANLQAWYNQENADAMAGGGGGSGNQWWYNPASAPKAPVAAPAAAAPAAPAPRILTAFDPSGFATPTTPATTAVNPAGATPSTSNTTPTFGSGASATNANAIQSTTNYSRYDEGGDVAPTQLGQPPGLGGQGQSIPPFYYNPATYSQAGAPVGKGFTQNSAATYSAAPVPTYSRGGVVMGYDDGGDVDDTQATSPVPTPTMDSSPPADTSQADMPAPAAQDVSMMRPSLRMPAPRAPHPSLSAGGGRGKAGAGASGVSPAYADENDPNTWNVPVAKPSNAPPEAPQIMDNQGNLSSGVTGAIAAGLHGLAQFLQMGPWQQGVPNQQTAQNRRDFTTGVGAAPPQKVEQVENTIDPDMALGQSQRLLGAMEAVYKWHLLNSDTRRRTTRHGVNVDVCSLDGA